MRAKRRVMSIESLRPRWAAMLLGVAAFLVEVAPSSLLGQVAAPSGGEQPTTDKPARSDERSSRAAPLTYLGRTIAPTMSYSGADWLLRKSRDQEENPAKLWDALHLKAGQVVCDFGCGNGYHTLELAKRVGPTGLVYAVDIQPEMLEMLRKRADARGHRNIRPILATVDDPRLPAKSIDLVLMVDVYHELADPAAVLQAVRKSLRPGGEVALVEFREEDPDVPILPLHKMSKEQVHRELTANKFEFAAEFNGLPWQHLLAYRVQGATPGSAIPKRGKSD
jgi:SAM-dependent methyltransferase